MCVGLEVFDVGDHTWIHYLTESSWFTQRALRTQREMRKQKNL